MQKSLFDIIGKKKKEGEGGGRKEKEGKVYLNNKHFSFIHYSSWFMGGELFFIGVELHGTA